MTSREALDRMIWRFGLVLFLIGSLGAADGALLTARAARWIELPERCVFWPVYLFAAVVFGGACWLATTARQEGAFRERHDGALAVEHVSLPALLIVAWASTGDRWPGPTQIVIGAALAVCGLRSMRSIAGARPRSSGSGAA